MSFRTWAPLVLVAALAACASSSDRARTDPIRALLSADALLFVSFDTDGDLSASATELEAGIAREFTRADASGDGNLAPIEFQNWSNFALGGGQVGPYRLDFDRNVDNTITRPEFDTEMRGRWRDYDSDSNGSVTRIEMVRLVGQTRAPGDRRVQDPPWGETPPPARR